MKKTKNVSAPLPLPKPLLLLLQLPPPPPLVRLTQNHNELLLLLLGWGGGRRGLQGEKTIQVRRICWLICRVGRLWGGGSMERYRGLSKVFFWGEGGEGRIGEGGREGGRKEGRKKKKERKKRKKKKKEKKETKKRKKKKKQKKERKKKKKEKKKKERLITFPLPPPLLYKFPLLGVFPITFSSQPDRGTSSSGSKTPPPPERLKTSDWDGVWVFLSGLYPENSAEILNFLACFGQIYDKVGSGGG